ncbi:unnamed protein product, partial [Amoebophrya sp. A120]
EFDYTSEAPLGLAKVASGVTEAAFRKSETTTPASVVQAGRAFAKFFSQSSRSAHVRAGKWRYLAGDVLVPENLVSLSNLPGGFQRLFTSVRHKSRHLARVLHTKKAAEICNVATYDPQQDYFGLVCALSEGRLGSVLRLQDGDVFLAEKERSVEEPLPSVEAVNERLPREEGPPGKGVYKMNPLLLVLDPESWAHDALAYVQQQCHPFDEAGCWERVVVAESGALQQAWATNGKRNLGDRFPVHEKHLPQVHDILNSETATRFRQLYAT